MVQRGLTMAAGVVACLSLGSWVHAADADIAAVMDRIKALEAKNRDLETKLNSAQDKKQSSAAIDKAIARSDEAMGQVITAADPHCRPLKIGGYFDVSYQYNINKPASRNNNLRTFDRNSNDFNVHLAELNFERLPVEKGQAGFRVDLAYGTDAPKMASINNTGVPQDSIVDLQQAYVSYIAPVGSGLTLDAGKFVTWSGYEVIEAQDNINSSRSLLFGLAIPFTHTGVRATYTVWSGEGGCDPCGNSKPKWTLGAGIVNGWDNIEDQNDSKTLIFMSNLQATSWFNWIVTGTVGNEGFGLEPTVTDVDGDGLITSADTVDGLGNGVSSSIGRASGIAGSGTGGIYDPRDGGMRYLLDTSFIFTPLESLTLAFNADYAKDEQLNAEWYGGAAYLKWQFSKSWYLGLRGEAFNDKQGVRTGIAQTVGSGTITLDWALSEPLHMRFEYRHDDSNVDTFSDESDITDVSAAVGAGRPFRNDKQDTIMVQWLYKF